MILLFKRFTVTAVLKQDGRQRGSRVGGRSKSRENN